MFLGIFLIVVLTAPVFSESVISDGATGNSITTNSIELGSGTATTISTELQRFYNIAKAEVDFYSAVVNSMTALVPSDTLTADITKLQSDLVQIQAYASSGDRNSTKQFVQTTFETDRNTMKQDILAWRRTNYKSLTLEQKQALKASFEQSRSDFESSRLAAYKNFAYGRLYYFDNALVIYQNRISVLKANGLDVSSLNQLLADAKTTIVDPLQAAINSATNASSLNQAIKQYALFDGSQAGINFHLASKFNIALLQIALDKLTATSGILQASITQLQNDINTANSVLSSVGTKQYTANQKTQIWNAIKDGFNAIRSSSPQVNSAAQP